MDLLVNGLIKTGFIKFINFNELFPGIIFERELIFVLILL